jgi:predicted aminopeptidase
VDERWEDDKRIAAFWAALTHTLDSAFKAHPNDRAARLAARARIYGAARRELVDSVGPELRTYPRWYVSRVKLDNAAVLARRVYASGLGDFDVLWARNHGDLRATIRAVIALARANPEAPLAALHHAATQ